ncbi:ankyrin repeat-containing protein [[Candida] railenensis]|uniref:Ankyrin repeat-containing protein n=1 Tax=[Candida] railenensis TaxID=45579 RepID=A0A9P0QLP9_9ASCO|nr:ankyrin repeat-containing protein [[Candida] railenensis]
MVSNIWIAAADNEIEVVKKHLESGDFGANSKDPNGYTPIHAAASYGNLDLLRLLISSGGDINIQDNEGDTPLHHVEDLQVAKALIEEFQADWKLKNGDGQTPGEYIQEEDEFPELAIYLKSLAHDQPTAIGSKSEPSLIESLPAPGVIDGHQISYSMKNELQGDEIDINLMGDEERRKKMEDILNSENPEEGLRELVQNAVAEGMAKYNNGNELEAEDSNKKRRK